MDRRSSVLKPGPRRVMPGSVANSFLYHRLIGNEFGIQMPPTGPLRPEQIQTIKAWTEQGAEWPDSLANEVELPPVDPKAVAMVEALCAAAAIQERAYLHAWSEVYLPGGGWRAYDPSQGLAVAQSHVALAAADPRLAAPATGTYRGQATAKMEFDIKLTVSADNKGFSRPLPKT